MGKGILGLGSKVAEGKYEGMTVGDAIGQDRKAVLELYRLGYDLEDEVYEKARFSHKRREEKVDIQLIEKAKPKDDKVYAKDVKNVKKIIEELYMVDKPYQADENMNEEEEKSNEIYE